MLNTNTMSTLSTPSTKKVILDKFDLVNLVKANANLLNGIIQEIILSAHPNTTMVCRRLVIPGISEIHDNKLWIVVGFESELKWHSVTKPDRSVSDFLVSTIDRCVDSKKETAFLVGNIETDEVLCVKTKCFNRHVMVICIK